MTKSPGRAAVHRREDEQLVTTLTGDRLCSRCSYNLTGQPVVREAHYGILIVRCTECGEVAAVQEYPLLGRWAQRFGVFLAALWFAIVLAMWPGSVAAIFGGSLGATEEAVSRFGGFLNERHQDWLIEQGATGNQITWQQRQQFLQKWWDDQDARAILAELGGLPRMIDNDVILVTTVMSVVAVAIGCLWSAVLIVVRRPWLLLYGATIALGVFGLGCLRWLAWMIDEPASTWRLGGAIVGPPFLFTIIAWLSAMLLVGLWFGRPILRLLVRALLPPRLRGPLSLLWTTDGKAVPR